MLKANGTKVCLYRCISSNPNGVDKLRRNEVKVFPDITTGKRYLRSIRKQLDDDITIYREDACFIGTVEANHYVEYVVKMVDVYDFTTKEKDPEEERKEVGRIMSLSEILGI